MEFSSWPIEELKALAMVYLKHKQHRKAQALRTEMQLRLQDHDDLVLKQLSEQLDVSNVVSLTERIFGRHKQTA